MTRFVGGQPKVNLAHVAKARVYKEASTAFETIYEVCNSDGERLGLVSEYELEQEPTGLLPAEPGLMALVVRRRGSKKERPTEKSLSYERTRVVGWRVSGKYAEPILFNPSFDGDDVYLEVEGKLLSSVDGVWYDLEELKELALSEAVRDWEREQGG